MGQVGGLPGAGVGGQRAGTAGEERQGWRVSLRQGTKRSRRRAIRYGHPPLPGPSGRGCARPAFEHLKTLWEGETVRGAIVALPTGRMAVSLALMGGAEARRPPPNDPPRARCLIPRGSPQDEGWRSQGTSHVSERGSRPGFRGRSGGTRPPAAGPDRWPGGGADGAVWCAQGHHELVDGHQTAGRSRVAVPVRAAMRRTVGSDGNLGVLEWFASWCERACRVWSCSPC